MSNSNLSSLRRVAESAAAFRDMKEKAFLTCASLIEDALNFNPALSVNALGAGATQRQRAAYRMSFVRVAELLYRNGGEARDLSHYAEGAWLVGAIDCTPPVEAEKGIA